MKPFQYYISFCAGVLMQVSCFGFPIVESEIALGEVLPNSTVPFSVKIKNSSDESLTLRNVVPSCTCAAINFQKPIVLPANSEYVLEAAISVPRGRGLMSAKIAFDFQGFQTQVCKISYEIQPIAELVPARLVVWNLNDSDLPITKNSRFVLTKPGLILESIELQSPIPWVVAKVVSIDKISCVISLTLTANAPVGLLEIPVRVLASVKGKDYALERTLTFSATIAGSVEIIPPAIFGMIGNPSDFSISGESIAFSSLKWKLVNFSSEAGYDVVLSDGGNGIVTVNGGDESMGGLLLFYEKTPEQPKVAVPIYMRSEREAQ